MAGPNPFGAPLVPTPPGMPGTPPPAPWNPMAVPNTQPNLNTFWGALKQAQPGAQFLSALKPSTPVPPTFTPPTASPYAPSAVSSPFDASIEAARTTSEKKAAEHDAAMKNLAAFNPPDTSVAPYQAPAPEKVNMPSTLGHVLAGLIAPRLAAFGQQGINYDAKVRAAHDAAAEHQAEIQHQAAETDAQRAAHYAEVDLSKRTALAEATSKDALNAQNIYDKQVTAANQNHAALLKVDAYAKNIISEMNARTLKGQQANAVIAQTAKHDAQGFNIKQAGIAQRYWQVAAQDANRLQVAGARNDVALQVAAQHVRMGLLETEMHDNTSLTNRMSADKAANLRAQVTAMKGEIGQVIAAASQPGAPQSVLDAAAHIYEKGGAADQLAAKIEAESGGAITAPQTSIQSDLQTQSTEALAAVTSPAPQVVINNNGAPSAAPMPMQPQMQPQAPQPGAQPGPYAPPGTPTSGATYGPQTVADFLNGTQGTPQQAPRPAPSPATHPQVSAQAQAAHVDPKQVAMGRQAMAVAARNGTTQNVIDGWAKANHVSPEQAAQMLGVGAAPHPAQAPHQAPRPAPHQAPHPLSVPTGPIRGLQFNAPQPSPMNIFGGHSPANPSSTALPAHLAPSPEQRSFPPLHAANTNQNPAQFALGLAKQANAQDGAHAPPPQQQVELLAKALVAHYKGMSPQQAQKIAHDAVATASGDLGGAVGGMIGRGIQGAENMFSNAGKAVSGYYRGLGEDALRRDAGGSIAAQNPPR